MNDGIELDRDDERGGLTTRRMVLTWGALGALGAPALAFGGADAARGPSAANAAASAPAGGAAASPSTSAPAAGSAAVPAAPLPAATLERYMKMHAGTGDGAFPWYYTGRIYLVREREAPRLLFTFEGTEIYWIERQGPGEWRTQGSTLTFFRDPATGAYLDSWANPVTGRSVDVRPNVLRSKPDAFSRIRAESNDLMPGVSLPWQVETHSVAGTCWLTTSRWLAAAPQPWLEAQTMMAPEAELANPRVLNATTTFASTYLSPWLKWMEMGDAPGHLVWHAAGRKLATRAEIPPTYLERAERASAIHFTAPRLAGAGANAGANAGAGASHGS